MRRWLKLDARNRAWRTILQGVIAVVVVPALVAGGTVVHDAVAAGGGSPGWPQTLEKAWTAALTAGVMAVLAYLHRYRLDPSAMPSAQPPRPPGATAEQAPATAPVSPLGR